MQSTRSGSGLLPKGASRLPGFLAGLLLLVLFLLGAQGHENGMALLLLALVILLPCATLIDLASVVGAFAAGLILEGVPFEESFHEEERSLEDLLHPLSAFLVPLFFIQMGLKIDLASLVRIDVLGLAFALTAVAVLGKLACGLGALERGLKRLSIGIGMIPRGEVGLIFAGVGLTLFIGGERIIDDALFSAILVMVIISTLITPPLLQWSFDRSNKLMGSRDEKGIQC